VLAALLYTTFVLIPLHSGWRCSVCQTSSSRPTSTCSRMCNGPMRKSWSAGG